MDNLKDKDFTSIGYENYEKLAKKDIDQTDKNFIGLFSVKNKIECLELCKKNAKCVILTYDNKNACKLFSCFNRDTIKDSGIYSIDLYRKTDYE